MIVNSGLCKQDVAIDLLCNLFEQMFEYNPFDRITIDNILKHQWVVNKQNDKSFYLSDLELEGRVCEIWNSTKHDKNIFHVEGPSTFHTESNALLVSSSVNESSSINASKAVSASSSLISGNSN